MLIRHKIIFAFGTVGVLFGASSLIAISINARIRASVTRASRISLEKPALAERAIDELQDLKAQAEVAAAQPAGAGAIRPAPTAILVNFARRLAACRAASAESLSAFARDGAAAAPAAASQELALLQSVENRLAALSRHLAADAAGGDPVAELRAAGFDGLWQAMQDYHRAVTNDAAAELAEIQSALDRADTVILWSSAGLLALGAGVAALAARTLTRPVGLLTSAVRALGAGRQDTPIPFESRDEFGVLIAGFNGMLSQIKARDTELRAAHDQLEKRAAEAGTALKAAMAQLSSIWESAPLSIMLLEAGDPEIPVKIVDCNPMACEMHGYTREELIGQCIDLIEARPWTKNVTNWLDSFRSKPRYEGESQHRRKDGTVFDIEYSTCLVVVNGREMVIGMDRDATARKKAENALEQMHRQLMDSSRQAGMAEVATGVLHNVGNVLNSVNVSATLVADQVRRSKAANIARVSEMLAQHRADLPAFLADDPKGRLIPAYLASLAENLATERQAIVEELDNLRKNIEHIKEIVSMQQSYAKTSGVNETVSIPDMVEDALRINAGSLARHDVDIARDYVARPVATLDKHKVIQILINLIRNAKYACDESGRTDKLITVRTTADDRKVRIAVIDNGIGIPAENLTRIFSHGFTTRETGHGFGLHSGALAAKELGGSLSVQSSGTGHGATFTLELPFKAENTPHEQS